MSRFPLWLQILALIAFVAASYSAGLIGSLTTETGDGSWYAQLEKPPFNPPGWAFGVVWPLLYTLMGIAAWLVWREGWSRHLVKVALGWFAAQLVLNALWTPVFFGAKAPLGGLVVISLLFISILITTNRFWRVTRVAGFLLVPYILWVAFAIALNAAIWMLN
jgi:translocator protein